MSIQLHSIGSVKAADLTEAPTGIKSLKERVAGKSQSSSAINNEAFLARLRALNPKNAQDIVQLLNVMAKEEDGSYFKNIMKQMGALGYSSGELNKPDGDTKLAGLAMDTYRQLSGVKAFGIDPFMQQLLFPPDDQPSWED